MKYHICIAIVTIVLFGIALAGHISHEHASSYASVIQHNHIPHHDAKDYGSHIHYLSQAVNGHDHHGYHHEPHHYPKYIYEYGVKDAHTGDHKSQWEHSDGDHVKGEPKNSLLKI